MTNNKEVTEQQYAAALMELELLTRNYELALNLGIFPSAKLIALDEAIKLQKLNIENMAKLLKKLPDTE